MAVSTARKHSLVVFRRMKCRRKAAQKTREKRKRMGKHLKEYDLKVSANKSKQAREICDFCRTKKKEQQLFETTKKKKKKKKSKRKHANVENFQKKKKKNAASRRFSGYNFSNQKMKLK